MASAFSFSGISARIVGISISMGMMASIPYVRLNDDMPLGSGWLFYRPIKSLEVPLPIFLWQSVDVFFRVNRSLI